MNSYYLFKNSLKITFYREIYVYIINSILKERWYSKMYKMENILDTLWETYHSKVIDETGDHFLTQLLDLHQRNKVRISNETK